MTTPTVTNQFSNLTTTTSKYSTITTSYVEEQKNQILVLSTNGNMNFPVITNATGREDRNFYFVMGEATQARFSCSLTFKNRQYVFGGNTERRQISQIVDCSLKRIDTLKFDHFQGACTNFADTLIYLCFNDAKEDEKKCRVSNSPNGEFEEINKAINDHRYTRIASNDCKCL